MRNPIVESENKDFPPSLNDIYLETREGPDQRPCVRGEQVDHVEPLRLSLLLRLCLVGFFVNCQPSEPFLTEYLIENKVADSEKSRVF